MSQRPPVASIENPTTFTIREELQVRDIIKKYALHGVAKVFLPHCGGNYSAAVAFRGHADSVTLGDTNKQTVDGLRRIFRKEQVLWQLIQRFDGQADVVVLRDYQGPLEPIIDLVKPGGHLISDLSCTQIGRLGEHSGMTPLETFPHPRQYGAHSVSYIGQPALGAQWSPQPQEQHQAAKGVAPSVPPDFDLTVFQKAAIDTTL